MTASQLSRTLYKMSRAVGDVNAVQRGRLPQRVVRRRYRRGLIRLLRSLGVW